MNQKSRNTNESADGMTRDPQLDAAYRAGAEAGPPARLDGLIRAAARREAGSGPRPLAVRRRWQMPLALAAVLVLSVSVVTTMREQGADRLDQPLPAISHGGSDGSTENKQPAAKAEVMGEAAAPPAMSVAAPATASPAGPTMAPAQTPAELQAFAAEKRPAPPAVAEAPAAPALAAQPPMMARSEAAAMASQGATGELRSAEAPAAAPRALMRAPAASADAAGARSPAVAISAPPAPWQDLVGKPAAQWLQRILELRRAQRLTEAEAVAAEFHKRFPDERLPEAGQP